MPQGHGYEAAHPNQRSNPGHRATALRLVQMHPNRGQGCRPAIQFAGTGGGPQLGSAFRLSARRRRRGVPLRPAQPRRARCRNQYPGPNRGQSGSGAAPICEPAQTRYSRIAGRVRLLLLRILRYRSPMSCRDPRPWGIADRVPQDQRCRQQHDRAGLMTDGERDWHDEEQGRDAERHL